MPSAAVAVLSPVLSSCSTWQLESPACGLPLETTAVAVHDKVSAAVTVKV
jgi:hypothetical protein